MVYELIAPVVAELNAFEQGGNAADINVLQQHLMETQIRVSDIGVRIGQLREQQARVRDVEQSRFDKPLADAQHENIVAIADMQMTEQRLAALKTETIVSPPHDVLFNQPMIEKVGTGLFTLMIPIVIALARRIWVRSGPRREQPVVDLESSPRMQRLEEAIESIAIEVERIGEAQRLRPSC